MKCIIVDDEPIARKGIRSLLSRIPGLELLEMFNNASAAADYLMGNAVDLIFLDIQMPGVTGIEFARNVPKNTLIIFTTAYPEYALDSYEVDAVDYLVNPVEFERSQQAATKAMNYHTLLLNEEKEDIEIAGFLAASLAWGQRPTIIKKCKELMQLMDYAPHDFVMQAEDQDYERFCNFKHRTFNS